MNFAIIEIQSELVKTDLNITEKLARMDFWLLTKKKLIVKELTSL